MFRAISRGGVGAEKGVTEIYDTYARRLLGFVRTMGFTLDEAEDVVQESFLKIYRAGAKLRGVKYPRAYLYKTIRNSATNLLRQKKKVEDELVVDSNTLVTVAEKTATTATTATTHDDQHLGFDDCLGKAFAKYESDDPDRAFVVRLAVVEGLDGHEIAAAIGRSYGAAREFLSQSRKRFRELVTRMCGDYLPGGKP